MKKKLEFFFYLKEQSYLSLKYCTLLISNKWNVYLNFELYNF